MKRKREKGGGAWLGAELALQLEYLYGHITPNVGTLCKQQRIGSKIQMRIRIRPMCNVCAGVCVYVFEYHRIAHSLCLFVCLRIFLHSIFINCVVCLT